MMMEIVMDVQQMNYGVVITMHQMVKCVMVVTYEHVDLHRHVMDVYVRIFNIQVPVGKEMTKYFIRSLQMS